jgi:hypothetical protein
MTWYSVHEQVHVNVDVDVVVHALVVGCCEIGSFRGRGSKLPQSKAQASLRTPKARFWCAVACLAHPRPGRLNSIQGATTVMLRLGTCPTGMIALTFKLLMSTADVVFEPAFAT